MRTAPASRTAPRVRPQRRSRPSAARRLGRLALAVVLWGVFSAAAIAPAGAAQRDFYFHRLEGERALAQNTVSAIAQDAEGFVWIATQGGLHRYDGQRHRVFRHDADDPASLPDSLVRALALAPDGRLFVGTDTHGVARLDPDGHSFHRYVDRNEPAGAARPHSVGALLFQPGVGLWVGTDGGLELLDPDGGERRVLWRDDGGPRIRALARRGDGVVAAGDGGVAAIDAAGTLRMLASRADVRALAADGDGTLWLGAQDGLYRQDGDDAPPVRVFPEGDGAGAPVLAMATSPDGLLWFSVQGLGLVRLDPASGDRVVLPYRPELPASLPEADIRALMVDDSGLLWVGGQTRGVATTYSDGAPFSYIVDLGSGRDPIATNNLREIFQAADGALWLGTEGDGLKRYDLVSDRFERFTDTLLAAAGERATQTGGVRIRGIARGDAGRLLLSGNLGLIELDPDARVARALPAPQALLDAGARAILRASDGALWVGTSTGGVFVHRADDDSWTQMRNVPGDAASLSNDLVNTFREDGRGRIWVGTLDGLNLYDPARGGFVRFLHEPRDPSTPSGNVVRAVYEDRAGALWIGSHSGLDRVVESDGAIRFEHVDLSPGGDGSRTVYAILEDDQARLWLSGNDGILRYDAATGGVRRFALRDGLQDLEFNGGAALRLDDGRLAFGGIRGLNVFEPSRVEDSSFAPPVVLTALRAGNTEIDVDTLAPGDAISLPQASRVVRFEFAALDYASPDVNQFRYRLDGFDDDWTLARTQHDATYTNLDPGRYVFRVRASNRDGVWSGGELAVRIHIVAPWWNSRAAQVAYVVVALLAVVLVARATRRRHEQERRLLQEITEREERLKLALWGSGDEFWDWNVKENTIYRLGADELLGLKTEHESSTDEWRSRSVHPDDLPRVQQVLQEHIVGHTDNFESEHRLRNARGEWIWVRSRGKVVARDADGNPLRIAGTARDITASRRAERERRIASEVLRSMSEAVAVADLDFRFASVNPAFSRITGFGEDEVVGKPSSMLNSQQHSPEFYRKVREAVQNEGHWQGEMWQKRKDGEEFLGWIEMSEVRDAAGERTHFVAVVNDITDKKRAEQELRYLANYDTLTGLPNRTLLSERLARAVVRARRQDSRVAVLFLDLDRFKDINDSMGHAAGDRILKAAAARLLATVRSTDTVARLGGDEFTVVLEEIDSRETAERIAQKILDAFAEPLDIDGRSDVQITPSIGVSLYPDHGLVPTDLLKFADTAMYQAKDRGRNTYQFYTEAMDAEARRRATMIAALRKGLDRGEFRLVFQPRLSLLDGRITGVEALLRWNSEDIGEVPPGVFIPIAEETGMILQIGEWVLREACVTLKRWRHHGLNDLGMAVNVSVLQFLRGDLPGLLSQILAEIAIPPDRLELEVTESMVMANAEQTTNVLRELKKLGVTLAIDDFGTGYSSLVYLKRLPIDTLKIDKEFIGDITTDPDDEAITATVITMAHSLGLNVVAEGVESGEQLSYLREQGCDEIQGFWLSPPLDVHHCLAFIRSYRPGLELGRAAVDLPY